MRVPGLHKLIERHGPDRGRHRRGRPAAQNRWQLAGLVAAMITLAALATAQLPGRPVTSRYDAARAADAVAADPFIDDEVLDELVTPEQLDAVPVGPGRVAKPVRTVLSGAPVIRTLGESGIPDVAVRAYKKAEARLAVSDPGCGVPWTLLAAIGRVESNHGRFGGAQLRDDGSATRRIRGIPLDGRPNVALIHDSDGGALDGDTAYDRAVGPMQFIPSTWRAVNADGNGDGFADPNNMFDAAQGAAQYLCTGTSGLRDPARAAQAVRRYNNADSYVRVVLGLAQMYQAGRVVGLPSSGELLPDEPIDPPGLRSWPTNEPPAARSWPTDAPPGDTVLARPAPTQRTELPTPPRAVTRPRTTAPPTNRVAPRPSKTLAPKPATTTTAPAITPKPSEPAPAQPPQPKPSAPKPTEPRPSEPERTEPPAPKPSAPKPTEPRPSEPERTEPPAPKPSAPKPTEPRPSEPEPTKTGPSQPKPSEAQPPESGSPTPAPSAEPTSERKPATAAVGWAPAMREVVGRALARPACAQTHTPQPDQRSKTCPADSATEPSPDTKDRCTPQHTCKVPSSPRSSARPRR